jgi:tetratricopeptide (TPR) repeat protein
MSRNVQAFAGIGLALGGIVLLPTLASAQYNRVPDPNATRVMVSVFKATEKGLGVNAADALRSRMTSEFPFKQVYVLPKQDINATLEASGFPTTDALQPHDARALANLLRADEYLTGSAVKTATGYKMEASLVLARDNALVQPLGSYDAPKIDNGAALIAKELMAARKQLEFEKKCVNSARDGKLDAAIAAAKEGIAAYPKATLARICMANVLDKQNAPAATQLALAREIVSIDAYSRPGLAIMASQYKALNQPDSAVLTLTRLLSTDPSNPRLQKDVVDAIGAMGNPAMARPVIDTAVAMNPGDPDLLSLRWKILRAVKDYKAAYIQGEELVKLDTSFADTTYFSRTAAMYAADSQFQKSAEFAAKGLAKFPGNAGLTYDQILGLKNSGQGQQALDALTKAMAAKIPVDKGAFLRLTLLKELNRNDEIVPAVRDLVATGDTSSSIRSMVIAQGQAQAKGGTADDFAASIKTLLYADSISKGQVKQQAGFVLGSTYLRFAQLKLQAAQGAKSCPLSKEGKDLIVNAQIELPKGGQLYAETMRTLMGAAMQLDGNADQLIKAYCK